MLAIDPTAAPVTVPMAPKNEPRIALVAAAPAPAISLFTPRSFFRTFSSAGVAAAARSARPARARENAARAAARAVRHGAEWDGRAWGARAWLLFDFTIGQ